MKKLVITFVLLTSPILSNFPTSTFGRAVYVDISLLTNFSDPKNYETDDFTTLRLNNHFFVDKSLLIYEFLQYHRSFSAQTVVRPKGWGKSTNINMLEKFFQIEVDETGNPLPKDKTINDKLFLGGTINLSPNESKHIEPLKIASISNATQHLGKYPVILLRLKNATATNYQQMQDTIKSCVVRVFQHHKYLSYSSKITDKEKFDKYLSQGFNTEEDLASSLHFLTLKLKEHFDRDVFILVDDYDVPIVSAYLDFKNEDAKDAYKVKGLLRYMLRAARRRTIYIPSELNDLFIDIRSDGHLDQNRKVDSRNTGTIVSNTTAIPIANTTDEKTNDTTTQSTTLKNISFTPDENIFNTAFLTGVYDLCFENTLTQGRLEFDHVHTVFDDPFAKFYGLTFEEIQYVLTRLPYGWNVKVEWLKSWYNGYNFRYQHKEVTHFYNLRSVMRFLHSAPLSCAYYGDDINTEGLISKILSSDEIQEDIQLLLAAGYYWFGGYTYYTSPVRWERIDIPQVLSDTRTVLLFNGLLGPVRPISYTNGPNIAIPNKEAECVYQSNLMRWVYKKFHTDDTELRYFAYLISHRNITKFSNYLQKYLHRTSEFIRSSEFNANITYGGLMTALRITLVGLIYNAEYHTTSGTIRGVNDILLVPELHAGNNAIIIQYKVVKEEKDLTSGAEAVLEQLNKHNYNGTFLMRRSTQIHHVYKMAIAFCGPKAEIKFEITNRDNETWRLIL